MRRIALPIAVLGVCSLLLAAGCERSDAPPPAAAVGSSGSRPRRRRNRAPQRMARRALRGAARLLSPLLKTQLGRKDDYDRVDDFSESRRRRRSSNGCARRCASSSATSTAALLTPEAQTSYDLWRYGLERAEAARPFRRRGYVFHQMQGPHTVLPQATDQLPSRRRRGRHGRVRHAPRRSRRARCGKALERAQLAAGEGVHAPRFAYDAVIEQSRAVITGAPFGGAGDSPLFADVNAKIAALVAGGKIDAARADELRAAATAALLERVQACVRSHHRVGRGGPREQRRDRDGRLEAARRPRVLRRSSRREHDDGDDGRRDPRARPRGGRPHPRGDGGDQAASRFRRHAAGVLRLAARQPAVPVPEHRRRPRGLSTNVARLLRRHRSAAAASTSACCRRPGSS